MLIRKVRETGMAEKNRDKAVVYSGEYVKALSGAAEELSGMMNAPDLLASEPKGFSKLRNAVTGIMALGEDSTPGQVQDSLDRLGSVAGQCVQDMKESGQDKKNVYMIYAKGLDAFAKNQKETFLRCTKEALNPEQPINAQEMEKRAAGRVKVSLDNLQKEVQGVMKEKHERVHTAENKGPSKSASSMGKR